MHFFKKNLFLRIFYITLSMVLCTVTASCQRQLSPQALNAIGLFEKKEYTQAYPKFKILLEKYPKDALYQFYTGACLVELGQNSEDAFFYLKSASAKNAHSKTFYYLGKAYYNQFQFIEAMEAYMEMQKSGRRIEIKEVGLFEEIQRTKHASFFFTIANDFDVLSKNKIPVDSLNNYLTNWFDFSQIDDLPTNSKIFRVKNQKNEIQIFSKPGKNGDRDLYITKIKDTKLTEPEPLSNIINSEFDEDFAVFIESESMLYFSSKGHNSVGGYDIFCSKLANGTWSAPEQLPFPINTPWDDFLFFSSDNNQYFFTNRKMNSGGYMLFTITNYQKSDILTLEGRNEILNILNKKVKSNSNLNFSKNENINAIKDDKPLLVISADERQQLITDAFVVQKTADSLLFLARKIITELHTTDDPKQRSRLFANYGRLEKKSAHYQEKANELYVKISGSTSISPDSATVVTDKAKKHNLFSIEKKSPYTKSNPISFDYELPSGVSYRIQLGAFSKSADIERFSGMAPLTAESLQDGKIIKYYVGVFSVFDEAEKALRSVKEFGFKEAFIVSYFDNKKIPLERAKELE